MNFKKIDIRKLLANGVKPFPHIRKKVNMLKKGDGISVITPFLPSPLIEVLRSEGFDARVEHAADGSWVTNFWRKDGVS